MITGSALNGSINHSQDKTISYFLISGPSLAMNMFGSWVNIGSARVLWLHLVYFWIFSYFQLIILYLDHRYILAIIIKPDADFWFLKLIYYILAMVLALDEAILVIPAFIVIILEIF
jgi:hypothetical protein